MAPVKMFDQESAIVSLSPLVSARQIFNQDTTVMTRCCFSSHRNLMSHMIQLTRAEVVELSGHVGLLVVVRLHQAAERPEANRGNTQFV